MEETKLWQHIKKDIVTINNSTKLSAHIKEAKEKGLILESMKDHFRPHIAKKKTFKKMFEALFGLFQSSCVSQQMLLQNNIPANKMSKTNIVVNSLSKITKLRDQLPAIGRVVEDKVLVSIALNALVASWRPFV